MDNAMEILKTIFDTNQIQYGTKRPECVIEYDLDNAFTELVNEQSPEIRSEIKIRIKKLVQELQEAQ